MPPVLESNAAILRGLFGVDSGLWASFGRELHEDSCAFIRLPDVRSGRRASVDLVLADDRLPGELGTIAAHQFGDRHEGVALRLKLVDDRRNRLN